MHRMHTGRRTRAPTLTFFSPFSSEDLGDLDSELASVIFVDTQTNRK